MVVWGWYVCWFPFSTIWGSLETSLYLADPSSALRHSDVAKYSEVADSIHARTLPTKPQKVSWHGRYSIEIWRNIQFAICSNLHSSSSSYYEIKVSRVYSKLCVKLQVEPVYNSNWAQSVYNSNWAQSTVTQAWLDPVKLFLPKVELSRSLSDMFELSRSIRKQFPAIKLSCSWKPSWTSSIRILTFENRVAAAHRSSIFLLKSRFEPAQLSFFPWKPGWAGPKRIVPVKHESICVEHKSSWAGDPDLFVH